MMITRARTLRLTASLFLALSTSIAVTAQQPKKLEYSILIDSTGSMRSQFDSVLELGKALARQLYDHGPVSIFRFRSEGIGTASRAIPTVEIERTQDQRLLDRTIEGIYIEGGQTTLLDAVQTMAERLNRSPVADAKVIILITDGEDRVSESKRKEVVAKLKENHISVYAIGLVRELDGGKRSKAIDLLKALATETGGRAVFPKSQPPDIQSLLAELAVPIP